ncbi:unnamed protein product, partial [Ilex paraguariensis]
LDELKSKKERIGGKLSPGTNSKLMSYRYHDARGLRYQYHAVKSPRIGTTLNPIDTRQAECPSTGTKEQ